MNATIPARRVEDFYHAVAPGDYFLTPPDEQGNRRLSFICPCGEGHLAGIAVGPQPVSASPAGPVWSWDGNEDCPTVTPSINVIGCWHGFLTAGVFQGC